LSLFVSNIFTESQCTPIFSKVKRSHQYVDK